MPMLKTVSAGKGSVVGLQTYLTRHGHQEAEIYEQEVDLHEQGSLLLSDGLFEQAQSAAGAKSRALFVDVSDDLTIRNWGRQMDLTRFCYNHDVDTIQGKSRSYYHFILSPDPADDCSVDTLRSYAQAWVQANFRSKEKQHEYAVVAHDDNETGVLHAHIVVNATNKKRGRKLHLNNDEVVALQVSAQTIGLEYGLSPLRKDMQRTVGARTTQPVYMDRDEREMLNRGQFTWKWELRQFVSLMAPLSNDFADFKQKLNHAGYNVELSERTGYLLYTHKNGLTVKDSHLGSRFYLDALERSFGHERLAEDPAYQSWQLLRYSKGRVPWKEDLREAIDAIAPTVVSIPELQEALEQDYGIRLTVNRRGLQYRHPSGLRVQDTSLGFRYTQAGLRHNASIGNELPYPGHSDILHESAAMVRHYLPRSPQGVPPQAPEWTASHFVFQDLAQLMVARNVVSPSQLAELIDEDHKALLAEKEQLALLRQELMRFNHLASLQTRCRLDREQLQSPGELAEDAGNIQERYERTRSYLEEQLGEADLPDQRKRAESAYEAQLEVYQGHLDSWSHASQVYRNYLMGRAMQEREDWSVDSNLDASSLFQAGRTLTAYRIRDYFHLEQTLSSLETRADLVGYRLEKLTQQRETLERIEDDIRIYTVTGPYVESFQTKKADTLTLEEEAQMYLYRDACQQLKEAGIDKRDFAAVHQRYKDALAKGKELSGEQEQIQQSRKELTEAQKVCLAISSTIQEEGGRGQNERMDSRETNLRYSTSSRDFSPKDKDKGKDPMAFPADLPLEEARRRRQERIQQAPHRSRRHRTRER